MKKSGAPITAQFRKHAVSDDTLELELSEGQAAVAALPMGSVALAVGWPGSGKTTALKALFLRLAKQHKPEQILVIAANRFAANKLRDELALSYQGATLGPLARSLSSIAFAIIRHHAIETGSKLPELVTGAEQDAILESILQRVVAGGLQISALPKQLSRNSLGLNGFRAELRDLLAVAIEYSVSPEKLRALAGEKKKPEWNVAADLYQHYLAELAITPHRYDPSALLVEAAKLLEDYEWPAQLAGVQQILLDDAQELTPAAKKLISTLCSRGAGLVMFGDPDVTTLGFRAADPEMMHELGKDIAGKRDFVQFYIYPSHATHPAGIAAAISRITPRIPVAKAGPQRKGFTPPAQLAEDHTVTAKVFTLQQEESAWLANQLRFTHLEQGVDWKDMAVVARSVDELEELENALAAESVPVRIIGARTALKDEFGSASYLKLLKQVLAKSQVSYEVAIDLFTSPISGFDAITLRRLRRSLRSQEVMAGGTRTSQDLLAELFLAPGSAATIETVEGKRAQKLVELFFELRELAAKPETTVEDLLWHAWSNSAPSKTWPKQAIGSDEVALQVARNLDSVVALFGAAARYVERNPLGTAIEFVEQQLSLKLPEDTLGFSANAQHSVSLLTPAGLIGRRFKVLALAHMQEGIWPNLRPRSSLLGAQQLGILLQNPKADLATQQRSELPSELRMLYKAVGAATEKLLVSAIDTEEEQVSQFVRALAGHDVEAEEYTQDRLTLRGLVGSLRKNLILAKTDGERMGIAIHLARLANEGVPGAHPDSWYGLIEPSTTAPLAELGVGEDDPNRLVLHPSELENFLRCPLHWFISAHGGSDQNFKTRVGTLMHEVLETATTIDEKAFWQIIDSKWHTVEFDSDWQEAAERRRVGRMISKLLGYLTSFETAGGKVIGREVGFNLEVAGAHVRGKVDRIEIYPNGDIVIADLKTSKYPIKKDVETNPQLGVYQLAALEERFEDIPQLQTDPQLAGAVLLEVGTKEAQVVAKQDSIKDNPELHAAFMAQLGEITEGMTMRDQVFTAKITEHCNADHGFGSCSLHLIEQVSYGR
ncbi:MAG: hypothetical protein RLZZ471_731 [Actinomycetota bacterium]